MRQPPRGGENAVKGEENITEKKRKHSSSRSFQHNGLIYMARFAAQGDALPSPDRPSLT
jgi:hypothetical protein